MNLPRIELSLELLEVINACESGIDFAVRNNLIGRDVHELRNLESHDSNLNWLRSSISNRTVIQYDEKGRIVSLSDVIGKPYYVRRYEDDLLVYEKQGRYETIFTYEENGDVLHQLIYNGNPDGYKRLRNGIEIEGENSSYVTSSEFDGDTIIVNLYKKNSALKRRKVYKNGVMRERYVFGYYTEIFNEHGLQILEKSEHGNLVEYEYDANNNHTFTKINGVVSLHNVYNDKNQLIRSFGFDVDCGVPERELVIEYDDVGNIVLYTIVGRDETRYEYIKDDAGNLIDVVTTIVTLANHSQTMYISKQ